MRKCRGQVLQSSLILQTQRATCIKLKHPFNTDAKPMHPTLFTFGYDGLTIEAFITRLQTAQVKTAVDVRELPLSRKKGFSKSAFCAALSTHGIAYLHARTHAQRLSPLVLTRAFRGELVPQDPQDEPARVLLERIAATGSATSAGRSPRGRKPKELAHA